MRIELCIDQGIKILEHRSHYDSGCFITDVLFSAHNKIYGINSNENFSIIEDIVRKSCKKFLPNKELHHFIPNKNALEIFYYAKKLCNLLIFE